MTVEEKNKAIIRRMIEASNKRNLAAINAFIDEYMALDFVDHSSQVQGRESAKQGYATVLKEYPDFHRTIEDIIAEGDKVWFLEKVIGTASSGKKMDATALNIIRIVKCKAVEGWGGYIQKLLRQCNSALFSSLPIEVEPTLHITGDKP